MKNTKKFAAMIAALTLSACSVAPMFSFATEFSELNQNGQNAYNAYISIEGNERKTVDEWLETVTDETVKDSYIDKKTDDPTAPTATAGKITFTGETAGKHSYNVYKIFAGEAEANGMHTEVGAKLNNLEWAVNEDVQKALVAELQKNDTLKTEETNDFASFGTDAPAVADFAAVVAKYEADSAKSKAFAETVVKVFKAENVDATATGDSTNGIVLADTVDTTADGYYVIAETGITETPAGEYEGMTAYLLGVYDASAGALVTVKSDVPSFQKKLKDTNDSAADSTTDWQDSADYDINDDVPFQLKATLPSNYLDYKAYKLTFHDNFRDADGKEVFNFKQIDKVYVDVDKSGTFNDGDVEITADGTTGYSLVQNATTEKDSAIYNMEVAIANLRTIYNPTTLPENAAVIVEYTATLNEDAVIGADGNWNDAYLTYTTNPNWNGTPDNNDTPDEEKEHPKDSPVDTTVVFTYQTVIDKINPQGGSLTGANFTLAKKYVTAPAGKTELKVGETTYTGYYTVSEITATDKSSFEFKGLDDGDYILVETKAPDNYKIATKPVYFTITAEHTNDPETLALTSLTGAGTTGVTDDGFINLQMQKDETNKELGKMVTADDKSKINASFINTSGAELPSTGGIGTKIFYLGGGAMVAVAGVFLITKKRMGKSEN